MAFPTAVNSQITDAVTQANVKVLAEAPAMAMGAIFQSLAHATDVLFHNAVAAQQQQGIVAQAAANQGIVLIYTAGTAAATTTILGSDVADDRLSLLTALQASHGEAAAPKAATAEGAAKAAETEAGATSGAGSRTGPGSGTGDDAAASDTVPQEVIDRIREAVTFSNDTVLASAPDVIAGLRSSVDTMAHALETMNRVTHDNTMRMLLQAALATTLVAMIREPARSAEYEAVVQAIKRMT